jgi:asparagine synthetase B (glutamine-hydrolysing)
MPDQARPVLERMIHTLEHRGPDGYGFHAEPGVGLAHARLSIIDLATGDQPIHNERQTVWTVFNGEIFNYVELREALEAAGHRFYTHSDTEVISTACSRSPCGIANASAWSWRVTARASARCSMHGAPAASGSRPK